MKKQLFEIYLPAAGLVFALTATSVADVTVFTDQVLFDAATVTTLVEDFEAVEPKNTALGSFESNGNTYTGLGGAPFPNVYVITAGLSFVPPNTSSVLTGNGVEDYRVDLGTPSEAVGFDTYLNAAGPATVEVHGAGGLLDTIIHSHDPAVIGFLGITATEPITAIRWTTMGGNVIDTGIDNLRQGVVPEPTTLGVFVAGGLAMIYRRRGGGRVYPRR